MDQQHLVSFCVFLHELEVPCRRLVHPSKEVQGVATSGFVILGWQVLKFLFDFSCFEVIDLETETPWLFSPEIRIVLDGTDRSPLRDKVLWKPVLFYVRWVYSVVKQIEFSSQEVRHQLSKEVLAILAEDIFLVAEDESSIFRRSKPMQETFG
jgi:hypothetical protein